MKTIYVLVAREIEEGSEALVAFEDMNVAMRVLYTIRAYHEPFYEKWAHQLARSLDPAYAIARAAHPALVYSNCPSLTDIAEFDIQEVYFHPANSTALLKLGQGIPNALPLPTTNQQV